MEWISPEHLKHLIATYGYLAVGIVIALESMGLPLPGESIWYWRRSMLGTMI